MARDNESAFLRPHWIEFTTAPAAQKEAETTVHASCFRLGKRVTTVSEKLGFFFNLQGFQIFRPIIVDMLWGVLASLRASRS